MIIFIILFAYRYTHKMFETKNKTISFFLFFVLTTDDDGFI